MLITAPCATMGKNRDLEDLQVLNQVNDCEKEMAVFMPGKIPWMEESGRLQSMGLQRVGHD